MKKQTNICLVFFAGVSVALMAWAPVFADGKKDVSDPVLNEIIQNFGPRMPRFIGKHGKDVFVSDEPITRGSLMLALYEYDKSLKMPKKDSVSRQEFEELSAKFRLIESGADKQHTGEQAAGSNDITQIINDLMPNMPVLLDNSLNNSKIFSGLREEVTNIKLQNRDAAFEGQLKSNLEQTKIELQQLVLKVDALERSPYRKSEQPLDLVQTRKQLANLEKRISEIEKSKGYSTVAEAPSGSENEKASTSVIAKISMGLSMVAALFIAR